MSNGMISVAPGVDYDAVRQYYGIGQTGGIDDPNVSNNSPAWTATDWQSTKIDELISSGIKFNASNGTFDIPHQDRMLLGITDEMIGRRSLIRRQEQRNSEITDTFNLNASDLGINAGTSRADYRRRAEDETKLREGRTLADNSGYTDQQLGIEPGTRPSAGQVNAGITSATDARSERQAQEALGRQLSVTNATGRQAMDQARLLAEERHKESQTRHSLDLAKLDLEGEALSTKNSLALAQMRHDNQRADRKDSRDRRQDTMNMIVQGLGALTKGFAY